MLPVLLDLGLIKIYTFGVFLVLAFFWAAYLLWKNIRLTSYKETDVFDGLFLSLFGALIFSRFIYVILNFSSFGFDILKILLINGYPGLSLYGAIFGGLLTLFVFFYLKKIEFRQVIDYFISPVFLALAIGKMGSFFAGVEVGTKTAFPVAIKYVGFSGGRHLTSFYESILFFAASYFSYRLIYEIRKEKYQKGFSLFFFFWYVGAVSFLFDPLYESRLTFFRLNFNRSISGILLLTMSIYFLYHFKDLIFKKSFVIINSVTSYGRKTYKGFIKRSPKETTGNKGKN